MSDILVFESKGESELRSLTLPVGLSLAGSAKAVRPVVLRREMKEGMIRRVALILCGVALVLVPRLGGAQTVTVTNDSPPEVILLFLDTGKREFPLGQVRLYTNLLDALDARCEQDRTMISDQSVMATRIIEQDQRPGTRRINNVTFLREWLEAVRALPADPNRDCVPIAATLMAILG